VTGKVEIDMERPENYTFVCFDGPLPLDLHFFLKMVTLQYPNALGLKKKIHI